MRLDAVKRDVQTGGIMQVAKATVTPSAKIFDMFESSTYANSPLAITRELVANAIDAHTAAGKSDVPVEVTLPTALEPLYKVRDEGIGMSREFMIGNPDKGIPSKFMAYADGSTKDQSDDQIGGFGIGSKSPFAYTDQYTLRVVHEGVLSVYTMFKDADGIPAIGLQGETTTDEPNGVEVSFPVEDKDQETFHKAAQEALQYFNPIPKITNGKITPPEYTYRRNTWALRPTAGALGVIMGGVRYPSDANNLGWSLRGNAKLSPLLEYGIDITLPIGAAGIAMSREQLSYVPKTTESIEKALSGILDEVVQTFATMFDSAPTLWEAKVRLHAESRGGARGVLVESHAKYKGQPLTTSIKFSRYNIKDNPEGTTWHIPKQRSSAMTPRWQAFHELGFITPGNVSHLIVDDLPISPTSRTTARIRHLLGTDYARKDVLVLRTKSKAATKRLLKALGSPKNVIYTSALPVPPPIARTKSIREKVRMFTFTGERDTNYKMIINLNPGMRKKRRVTEVAMTDQPTSGILVVMDRFNLPRDLYEKMQTGFIQWNELYFVNEGDVKKLGNGFTKFETEWEKRLATAVAKYPELTKRLALDTAEELSNVFEIVGAARAFLPKLTPEQKARPFGQAVDLYDTYIAPLDYAQRALRPYVTPKLPKGVSPKTLAEAFVKEQPEVYTLLNEIGRYGFKWERSSHIAVLIKLL